MAVGRIQIDFGMLEGEELRELLLKIGDIVMPVLDPHEEDEACVRWVQIEAFEYRDDEFDVSFTPEEEEELIGIGVPQMFRDAFGNN